MVRQEPPYFSFSSLQFKGRFYKNPSSVRRSLLVGTEGAAAVSAYKQFALFSGTFSHGRFLAPSSFICLPGLIIFPQTSRSFIAPVFPFCFTHSAAFSRKLSSCRSLIPSIRIFLPDLFFSWVIALHSLGFFRFLPLIYTFICISSFCNCCDGISSCHHQLPGSSLVSKNPSRVSPSAGGHLISFFRFFFCNPQFSSFSSLSRCSGFFPGCQLAMAECTRTSALFPCFPSGLPSASFLPSSQKKPPHQYGFVSLLSLIFSPAGTCLGNACLGKTSPESGSHLIRPVFCTFS